MNPTLNALLASGAAAAPAIRAPGRPALSYAGLRDLTAATIARLNAIGIGRNDRVAIVLPNGPEMAAAFIAIGAGANWRLRTYRGSVNLTGAAGAASTNLYSPAYTLYNALGQRISSGIIDAQGYLSTVELASGNYIVRLSENTVPIHVIHGP